MKIEFKHKDYKISPHTGLTRDSWIEAGIYLLNGAFLDVSDFGVANVDYLNGFIKGIVAANGDNEYIYLDGIARISNRDLCELGDVFTSMDKLEKDYGVKFVLTCSAAKEDLPEFVLKYVD